MKYLARISYLVLPLIFIALVACGKGSPTATSDPNLVYTQIWETVAAGQTLTAESVPPTLEATNTLAATQTPKMTNTPLISSTPSSSDGTAAPTTNQPTAANTPRPTSQAVCDNSQFVTDVTYTDGTEVPAGQAIIKTWRIKNLGPCKWNQDYMLVFGWGGDGTEWSTTAGTHFKSVVEVGDTIDLSIELLAPTKAGTYSATYRTQNDKGFNFGPTLTILIVVK